MCSKANSQWSDIDKTWEGVSAEEIDEARVDLRRECAAILAKVPDELIDAVILHRLYQARSNWVKNLRKRRKEGSSLSQQPAVESTTEPAQHGEASDSRQSEQDDLATIMSRH